LFKSILIALCSFIALERASAQAQQSLSRRPSLEFITPQQIDGYLSKLKTHNKLPLRDLLASYGLALVRVDVIPIENYLAGIGHPSDRPGDRYVSLTIDGKPTRKMPCGLNSYQSPKMGYRSIANMVERGSEFIPSPDEGEDAMLHWAITGKCSLKRN
jgi:hypothetical protein